MNKIFLSHISEEAPLAIVLKEWIESTFVGQCEVFVSSDKSSNPPGSRWIELLDTTLSDSKAFIVLCSPHSLQRPWINFETGCGWIKRVPIIPICHSGQKVGALPMPISLFQGLELESDSFIDDLLQRSLAPHFGVQKLPRINKPEMQSELQNAVKGIADNIPNSLIATVQHKLEPLEMDILHDIAEFRSEQRGNNYIRATEARILLQEKYSINPIKVDYYLDKLRNLRLLSFNRHYEYYDITSDGRALLFSSGRLD